MGRAASCDRLMQSHCGLDDSLPSLVLALGVTDTCKRAHISTSFLRVASASRIGVARNHAQTRPLALLESAGAERFGKIERVPA